VRQVEDGEAKRFRTTVELHLTVKRFNDTIQLRMDTGTEEIAGGKVVGVFTRQYLGKDKLLVRTGTVKGQQLFLSEDGQAGARPVLWDDQALGLYRQHRLFQERQVKPGDRFDYVSYELAINRPVLTHVTVQGYDEVEWPGAAQRKRLLRVEVRPEKIVDEANRSIQLPTQTLWLDDSLTTVRSQVDVPGLGTMVLYRTTRAGVEAPGPVASLTDIGIGQLLRLNVRIPQPYDTTAAVYRVTYKGEGDPATVFVTGGRQQVRNVQGNTFELHVRASRGPEAGHSEKNVGDEFTQSSYFINSDDAKVKTHARRAVGAETDPWQKALRIEKWVHDNMRSTNDEALATADHVARTLQGDCTEYAMLTAAMCRAEGLPSRTAIGLVYAEESGPALAFHMWTEVWVRGQWLPIDATLGRGYVGATHLKITDHSWHETRTVTPLLPVVRVLGKLSVQVVSVNATPLT
jgi:transglutaminase-like putative cysteine protease